MSKPVVHIIAIQEKYLVQITKQMKDVLEQYVSLRFTPIKELQKNLVQPEDVIVLSHHMLKGIVSQMIPAECHCFVAKRDINFANTKKLVNLPSGQKILVINDNKTNIDETVTSLRETIFEHKYYPYNPDEPIPEDINFIVTPGEIDILPEGLIEVINIGSRVLSIETFFEIVEVLGIQYNPIQLGKRYMKSLVSLSLECKEEVKDQRFNRRKDIRNVASYTFQDIIAISETMQRAVQLAKEFAGTSLPIYLNGEHGTGKSMLAQAIHHYSFQANAPFISVNCDSKSTDMLEKELFGSEEGQMVTMGAFEIAKNGTVYLEDLDELHSPIQKKLLQAITDGEFLRIGGTKPIPFQARLISCSSKELKKYNDEGGIHSFYEFVTSQSLRVPSLRERREDILPLIEEIKRRLKKTEIEFTSDVVERLLEYDWPGNVIELYNTITYLAFLDAQKIEIELLPIGMRREEKRFQSFGRPPKEVIEKIEAHGFLEESVEILKIFAHGKRERTSYGRQTLKKLLEDKGMELSEQQLRMRMEVLQELDLLIVRQGRAGSTISRNGEEFLKFMKNAYS
ncbi:sigma 54-interacting transcriptional regulator [Neobacillus kokaensis]|uniref:Sigma-54 factor interaction domain-containing protein n=1 Tax=Neobacillus kokaensis TaxID=2759023 RepID=A0ABQ3N6U4_9BACI|nr:sigma 54-interacting transcriptional regulator [Neobacillus kokaensis]GHI00656.1 hypothetical protein AM1BK_41980 [Neobacillus kokaensis]